MLLCILELQLYIISFDSICLNDYLSRLEENTSAKAKRTNNTNNDTKVEISVNITITWEYLSKVMFLSC